MFPSRTDVLALMREAPGALAARGGFADTWELEPREESDSAYHCGADISMLSQFAAEQEVLFPPCCLLLVKDPPENPPKPVEEGGKTFVAIAVQPSFV